MKLVWKITTMEYPISLKISRSGRFQVVYGKQITKDLTYDEACCNLGQALMHALSLEGKMDLEDE